MIAFWIFDGTRGWEVIQHEQELEQMWLDAECKIPVFLARGAVREFLPAFERWIARSHGRDGT